MFGRPGRPSPRAGQRPSHAATLDVRTHPAHALGISNREISSAAMRTCETLQKAGYKAYVVGGGVRDLLLGLRPRTSTSPPMHHPKRCNRFSAVPV